MESMTIERRSRIDLHPGLVRYLSVFRDAVSKKSRVLFPSGSAWRAVFPVISPLTPVITQSERTQPADLLPALQKTWNGWPSWGYSQTSFNA